MGFAAQAASKKREKITATNFTIGKTTSAQDASRSRHQPEMTSFSGDAAQDRTGLNMPVFDLT
jgi:hypothetical protein